MAGALLRKTGSIWNKRRGHPLRSQSYSKLQMNEMATQGTKEISEMGWSPNAIGRVTSREIWDNLPN
jgi:hypothetical protein